MDALMRKFHEWMSMEGRVDEQGYASSSKDVTTSLRTAKKDEI